MPRGRLLESEPEPTRIPISGIAASRSPTAITGARNFARRIAQPTSAAQIRSSPACLRSASPYGMILIRSSRSPSASSSTGRSVSAQTTLTSGMTRPPTPNPRRNGTGTSSITANPTDTARPLKTIVRPACVIVSATASTCSRPWRRSSR